MADSEKRVYASRIAGQKRVEKYYPPSPLKDTINEYSGNTGVSKSELAVMLMKSFFAERKKLGQDPTTITLLPL